ncbi:MAG: 30S ribosomal protein S20 [Patescibacteria group bacterium]
MPVTKQAKKKLRKDIKREKENLKLKNQFKRAVKNTKKSPTPKKVSEANKIIDKAAKKNIIHKNKAARLKSRLAKLSTNKKSPGVSGTKPKNKAK